MEVADRLRICLALMVKNGAVSEFRVMHTVETVETVECKWNIVKLFWNFEWQFFSIHLQSNVANKARVHGSKHPKEPTMVEGLRPWYILAIKFRYDNPAQENWIITAPQHQWIHKVGNFM